MTEYPIPVRVRTARTRHACDDCSQPIEPGEKYELLTVPPHRMPEYDVPRWLTWRAHQPRTASTQRGRGTVTGWAEGMACRITEHDYAGYPLPGGRYYPATVIGVSAGLGPPGDVVLALPDAGHGWLFPSPLAFEADGRAAYGEESRWRLLPGTEDQAATAAGQEG